MNSGDRLCLDSSTKHFRSHSTHHLIPTSRASNEFDDEMWLQITGFCIEIRLDSAKSFIHCILHNVKPLYLEPRNAICDAFSTCWCFFVVFFSLLSCRSHSNIKSYFVSDLYKSLNDQGDENYHSTLSSSFDKTDNNKKKYRCFCSERIMKTQSFVKF